MLYLSEIINKKILYHQDNLGKVVDLVVSDGQKNPVVTRVVVKDKGKKYTLPLDGTRFEKGTWIIRDKNIEQLPYEEKQFFLVEDLLDKQVIDINGKRLVRVNDVVLKENGELKAEGIDVGFSGIFRRLGMGNFLGLKNITLPWSLIEAFDYQTGNVQIKVTQNRLNTFHPAEIADILEDAGAKERLGIVEALDAQKAAAAIEEANEETQSAILEQVSQTTLKTITQRMHLSELADVINQLNPFTGRQILKSLGADKANTLKKLLVFDDDEAGGLMDVSFYQERADKTVDKALESLAIHHSKPESLILVDEKEELVGVVNIKNIINFDTSVTLAELPMHTQSVKEDAQFSEIFRIFTEYNIRTLPVVDNSKHVLGIIRIDQILEHLQEEEARDDVV